MPDDPSSSSTSPDQRSWLDDASNWASYQYRKNVENRFSGVTESVAESVEKVTKDNLQIKKADAKQFLPMVGALLLGATSWAFLNPIQKGTQYLFGLLKKVPLIGGIAEKVGTYAAYAVPVAAGVLGYKMLSPSTTALPKGSETGAHLTGRVGDPPKTTTVRLQHPTTETTLYDEKVVSEPAAPPADILPAVQTVVDAHGAPALSPTNQIGLREKATVANNKELSDALEVYIGHYNKLYENRRQWAKAVEEFHTGGSRERLVKAFQAVGYTRAEAEEAAPNPKDYPPADIYSKGVNFPPELIAFIKEFEACYTAKGLAKAKTDKDNEPIFVFSPNKGDTPRPMRWDEMVKLDSVTLQAEYLRKAIRFVQERHKFFQGRKSESVDGDIYYVSRESYDYYDKEKIISRGGFLTPAKYAIGNSYDIDWDKEHVHIKKIFGIKYVNTPGFALNSSSYVIGPDFEKLLEEWEKQQKKADEHKGKLLSPETDKKIDEWKAKVALLEHRVKHISTGKSIVLSHYQSRGYDFIQVKDCRNPNCPRNLTLCFQKVGNSYKLTDYKNGMWCNGIENGGLLYANLPWNKPTTERTLTQAEFDELISGQTSPDTLVDSQKNPLKEAGISIVQTAQAGSRPYLIVFDQATGKRFTFTGEFDNGKFKASHISSGPGDTAAVPLNRYVTIDKLDDPAPWRALVDHAIKAEKEQAALLAAVTAATPKEQTKYITLTTNRIVFEDGTRIGVGTGFSSAARKVIHLNNNKEVIGWTFDGSEDDTKMVRPQEGSKIVINDHKPETIQKAINEINELVKAGKIIAPTAPAPTAEKPKQREFTGGARLSYLSTDNSKNLADAYKLLNIQDASNDKVTAQLTPAKPAAKELNSNKKDDRSTTMQT